MLLLTRNNGFLRIKTTDTYSALPMPLPSKGNNPHSVGRGERKKIGAHFTSFLMIDGKITHPCKISEIDTFDRGSENQ